MWTKALLPLGLLLHGILAASLAGELRSDFGAKMPAGGCPGAASLQGSRTPDRPPSSSPTCSDFPRDHGPAMLFV
uniref:Uncharacterized protein n=1 Tax=Sphaerodactylus townsendi TaxID=933632 RepID=A0ACB8FQI9_9SAUR